MPLKAEAKVDADKTAKTIEEDRSFLIQAAIVRIMKSKKTLKHANLVIAFQLRSLFIVYSQEFQPPAAILSTTESTWLDSLDKVFTTQNIGILRSLLANCLQNTFNILENRIQRVWWGNSTTNQHNCPLIQNVKLHIAELSFCECINGEWTFFCLFRLLDKPTSQQVKFIQLLYKTLNQHHSTNFNLLFFSTNNESAHVIYTAGARVFKQLLFPNVTTRMLY